MAWHFQKWQKLRKAFTTYTLEAPQTTTRWLEFRSRPLLASPFTQSRCFCGDEARTWVFFGLLKSLNVKTTVRIENTKLTVGVTQRIG